MKTWRASKEEKSNNAPERYEILCDGVLVAEVHHGEMEWEEFEANAKLIVSAQKMMSACENLIEAVEGRQIIGIGHWQYLDIKKIIEEIQKA